MYRELFAGTSVLTFQIIGLVSFLAVFIAVAIRTYSKKAEAYADTAALPLHDDQPPARPADTHGGP